MALAKHAEKIREIVEERMENMEQIIPQHYAPYYISIQTAAVKSKQTERDNASQAASVSRERFFQ